MAGNIEIKIKSLEGLTLAGLGKSGHWTMMDTAPSNNGYGAATSPFELLYMALGGCQSMDILSVLKKKRKKVDKFELNIAAKRRDEHPQITPVIKMEFLFWGKLEAKDIERAIELSTTKYCGVVASLDKNIEIIRTYRINPE